MMTGSRADMAVTTLDLDDPTMAAAADAFVAAQPGGTPFHRPAWMRAVARATSNKAHMLAAVAPSGQIVGLLPLHHIRSRLFGQALVSSGFAVDGGLLTSDPVAGAALGGAAQRLAAELGGLPVELRGGMSPGDGWTSSSDTHLGFVRPLAADDEAELLAVPRKHRAELRKALANGDLRVEHGRDPRHLGDHYRIYAESVRNLGTPVFPAALFREVMGAFGEDADITLIHEGDRPVSAVLSLYHGGHVMPFWGGGVQDARWLRSNELMYYRLMGHARARGMTHFDFGRSKAGSGQAAWKKSFGFNPSPLSYHRWGGAGAERDINPNNPKYQRRIDLWKRLPLPVANLIGPHIARGLG
ncbi:MAG: FemAB family PEP-CTERM system-associated protein [Sphingobium sp.]|nr:FemAB family PEP-CTERM system-associated protein [Sphingobium sp.]